MRRKVPVYLCHQETKRPAAQNQVRYTAPEHRFSDGAKCKSASMGSIYRVEGAHVPIRRSNLLKGNQLVRHDNQEIREVKTDVGSGHAAHSNPPAHVICVSENSFEFS